MAWPCLQESSPPKSLQRSSHAVCAGRTQTRKHFATACACMPCTCAGCAAAQSCVPQCAALQGTPAFADLDSNSCAWSHSRFTPCTDRSAIKQGLLTHAEGENLPAACQSTCIAAFVLVVEPQQGPSLASAAALAWQQQGPSGRSLALLRVHDATNATSLPADAPAPLPR